MRRQEWQNRTWRYSGETIGKRARDGHRVAYLVFDPRDEAIDAPQRRYVHGREVYFGSSPGMVTAAYHDRGLGYVVTSDQDEESLARLVTASFTTRPVPS